MPNFIKPTFKTNKEKLTPEEEQLQRNFWYVFAQHMSIGEDPKMTWMDHPSEHGVTISNKDGDAVEGKDAINAALAKGPLFIFADSGDEKPNLYIVEGKIDPKTNQVDAKITENPVSTEELEEYCLDLYNKLNPKEKLPADYLKKPEELGTTEEKSEEPSKDTKAPTGPIKPEENVDAKKEEPKEISDDINANINLGNETKGQVTAEQIHQVESVPAMMKSQHVDDTLKKIELDEEYEMVNRTFDPKKDAPDVKPLGFFASIWDSAVKIFNKKGSAAGVAYRSEITKREKRFYDKQKETNAKNKVKNEINRKENERKKETLDNRKNLKKDEKYIKEYNKEVKKKREENQKIVETPEYQTFLKKEAEKRDYNLKLHTYHRHRSNLMTNVPILGLVDASRNGLTRDNIQSYNDMLEHELKGIKPEENSALLGEYLLVSDICKQIKTEENQRSQKGMGNMPVELGYNKLAGQFQQGKLDSMRKREAVNKNSVSDERIVANRIAELNDPQKKEELINDLTKKPVFRKTLETCKKTYPNGIPNAEKFKNAYNTQKDIEFSPAETIRKALIEQLGAKPVGYETGLILAKLSFLGNKMDTVVPNEVLANNLSDPEDIYTKRLAQIAEESPAIKETVENLKGMKLTGEEILSVKNGLQSAPEIKQKHSAEVDKYRRKIINELGTQQIGPETGLLLAKLELLDGVTSMDKIPEEVNAERLWDKDDPQTMKLQEIANQGHIKNITDNMYKGIKLPGDAVYGLYLGEKTAVIKAKEAEQTKQV